MATRRDMSCEMLWFNKSCNAGVNIPVIEWDDLDFFLAATF